MFKHDVQVVGDEPALADPLSPSLLPRRVLLSRSCLSFPLASVAPRRRGESVRTSVSHGSIATRSRNCLARGVDPSRRPPPGPVGCWSIMGTDLPDPGAVLLGCSNRRPTTYGASLLPTSVITCQFGDLVRRSCCSWRRSRVTRQSQRRPRRLRHTAPPIRPPCEPRVRRSK